MKIYTPAELRAVADEFKDDSYLSGMLLFAAQQAEALIKVRQWFEYCDGYVEFPRDGYADTYRAVAACTEPSK